MPRLTIRDSARAATNPDVIPPDRNDRRTDRPGKGITMSASAASTSSSEPLKVYWQPGCTGCLRMKEFLTKHGVEFISVNVLADKEGLDELVKLAGRHVPI